MKLLRAFFVLLFLPISGVISAQVNTVLDGAYIKENTATKRVIPYPDLREADVLWSTRVWRVIDLREKINHAFYFPLQEINNRKNLFDVIKHALLIENSITAYSLGPTSDDDEFKLPMTREEVDSLLNPVELVRFEDIDNPGTMITEEKVNSVSGEAVTQYRIKEDWVFDKQRSERYVRILGICPMVEDYDDTGAKRGYRPLFWLYYPECRYVFANAEVFNRQNSAQRRSFEEIFQKRQFASYIYKEDNVYDRTIASYAQGVDALLESERIKMDLFELEHDLWHY